MERLKKDLDQQQKKLEAAKAKLRQEKNVLDTKKRQLATKEKEVKNRERKLLASQKSSKKLGASPRGSPVGSTATYTALLTDVR